MEYAKATRIDEMRKKDETDRNVNAYQLNFDTEIKLYKDKAIREIINMHPKFYRELLEYDDWESAMRFLNEGGADYINHFNNREGNLR